MIGRFVVKSVTLSSCLVNHSDLLFFKFIELLKAFHNKTI